MRRSDDPYVDVPNSNDELPSTQLPTSQEANVASLTENTGTGHLDTATPSTLSLAENLLLDENIITSLLDSYYEFLNAIPESVSTDHLETTIPSTVSLAEDLLLDENLLDSILRDAD